MSCCVSTRACHCGCFGFKLPRPERQLGSCSARQQTTKRHEEPPLQKRFDSRASILETEEIHCSAMKQLQAGIKASSAVCRAKGCTHCNEVREALHRGAWASQRG